MAKVTGIVSALTVDDSTGTAKTISPDATSVTMANTRGQQDVTGLDKPALERLGLLYDYTLTITGVGDFAAGLIHDVFKADPAANATRTVVMVLSNTAATLTAEMNRSDYSLNRTQAGELLATVTLVNADGAIPVWT